MPASTSLAAIDQKHLFHPLHHPSSHASARTWVSGRGAVITADTGRQYIDGLAGLVCERRPWAAGRPPPPAPRASTFALRATADKSARQTSHVGELAAAGCQGRNSQLAGHRSVRTDGHQPTAIEPLRGRGRSACCPKSVYNFRTRPAPPTKRLIGQRHYKGANARSAHR